MIDVEEFVRRGQAAQAAVDEITRADTRCRVCTCQAFDYEVRSAALCTCGHLDFSHGIETVAP